MQSEGHHTRSKILYGEIFFRKWYGFVCIVVNINVVTAGYPRPFWQDVWCQYLTRRADIVDSSRILRLAMKSWLNALILLTVKLISTPLYDIINKLTVIKKPLCIQTILTQVNLGYSNNFLHWILWYLSIDQTIFLFIWLHYQAYKTEGSNCSFLNAMIVAFLNL